MSLTKKGALLITKDLDRIATLVSGEYKTLGLPEKVASGFAEWCDRIADRIENTAGIDPQTKKADYPADDIGKEVAGPHEGDADEDYMKGEFTMQERRELSEMQQGGKLPGVSTDPRGPRPGVQASLDLLTNALNAAKGDEELFGKLAEAVHLAAVVAVNASEDDDAEEEEEAGEEKEASYTHGYTLSA